MTTRLDACVGTLRTGLDQLVEVAGWEAMGEGNVVRSAPWTAGARSHEGVGDRYIAAEGRYNPLSSVPPRLNLGGIHRTPYPPNS